MPHILLVEDDPGIAPGLAAFLESEGMTVTPAATQAQALSALGSGTRFDLLLLDIGLPDGSGFAVCAAARACGGLPVIFLTAAGEEHTAVAGLDMGADDYLPKPFAMGELLARVRAMLRRGEVYTPDVLSFRVLELDRGGSLLSSVSGSVTLTRLEYRMLEALMLNRGIYLSTEELLVKVWGYESEAEQGAVWVYVSYLRRRLAAVGSRVRIQVKRGVGYRLEAPDA